MSTTPLRPILLEVQHLERHPTFGHPLQARLVRYHYARDPRRVFTRLVRDREQVADLPPYLVARDVQRHVDLHIAQGTYTPALAAWTLGLLGDLPLARRLARQALHRWPDCAQLENARVLLRRDVASLA